MPTTGAEPGRDRFRLETDRLTLRRPTAADAPAIEALAGEWDVARHTANIPHPYPPGGAVAWLDTLSDEAEVVWAIERREDGTFLGCIGLRPDPDAKRGVPGYWIGKPHWGRGYATEALRAVVAYAFETRRFDRLDIAASLANPASQRVQEKLGFAVTGRAMEPAPARGGTMEVETRSLARKDWEAARRAANVPTVLVAAVALIDADGRVLLAERPRGKPMSGLWEFPGGKVAAGETPETALIRELEEELGIDVSERCLAPLTFASHRYERFHLFMPLYVCRVWDGRVAAREGQRLAWVRAEALDAYPMPPADIPLVATLKDVL
jgi:8-oxo-dGTP diphosphatase